MAKTSHQTSTHLRSLVLIQSSYGDILTLFYDNNFFTFQAEERSLEFMPDRHLENLKFGSKMMDMLATVMKYSDKHFGFENAQCHMFGSYHLIQSPFLTLWTRSHKL